MKEKSFGYEKPEVKEEVKVIEPVETGCCLRSCGGSPHHFGKRNEKTELEKMFDDIDQ